MDSAVAPVAQLDSATVSQFSSGGPLSDAEVWIADRLITPDERADWRQVATIDESRLKNCARGFNSRRAPAECYSPDFAWPRGAPRPIGMGERVVWNRSLALECLRPVRPRVR